MGQERAALHAHKDSLAQRMAYPRGAELPPPWLRGGGGGSCPVLGGADEYTSSYCAGEGAAVRLESVELHAWPGWVRAIVAPLTHCSLLFLNLLLSRSSSCAESSRNSTNSSPSSCGPRGQVTLHICAAPGQHHQAGIQHPIMYPQLRCSLLTAGANEPSPPTPPIWSALHVSTHASSASTTAPAPNP